jgi:hypothetical protein
MAQVAQCLLYKHKALKTSVPPKKKKIKNKKSME